MLLHETLYRTRDVIDRIGVLRVTVCGAGALGAHIAESLARIGCRALRVIDRDRIEEINLATQPYHRTDIGAMKTIILANTLYRAIGARIEARATELTDANISKLLRSSDLVVDTFDNSQSRRLVTEWCAEQCVPCLHAGMADGYTEVVWNEEYHIPSDAQDDICDYPLARNLVTLGATLACEAIIAFAANGSKREYSATLDDMRIISNY